MSVGPLLAALLLAQAAPLQPAPAPAQPAPAATPVAAPLPDPAADLGFAVADARMTVPVTIAAAGPFAFIVDTGAERTVIARQLAEHLHLVAAGPVRLTAMTGPAVVATVLIPSLGFGTIDGHAIVAPALEQANLGAVGMLGIDTLQGHRLVIDLVGQRMSVAPSLRHATRSISTPGEIVVQARNMLGQLVVTNAYYHGRRIEVVLDTGSAVTMGNPALERLVGRARRDARTISLLSVTGQSLMARYGQVDRMTLAGVAIASLPVAFADAAPFAKFGLVRRPALMLGMDVLQLFRRVEIDFTNREVRLSLPVDAIAAQW